MMAKGCVLFAMIIITGEFISNNKSLIIFNSAEFFHPIYILHVQDF